MISIIGIPSDKNSSFLRGCSKAPPLIMKEFFSESSNLFTESGINLDQSSIFKYNGCLRLKNQNSEYEQIQKAVYNELEKKNRCISIGGDHSITYPIISAYTNFYKQLNILHFDAHPDLYDSFDNNPFSHASPFARIMENNLVGKLTQVGIRTMNAHQKKQAKKYNVQVIHMGQFDSTMQFDFDGPVYVSIDLDALDPAFAPGVSHPEPGGISTRDLLTILSTANGEFVGGDIVEYNPKKDFQNITAILASKILKELMSKMI